MADRTDAAVPAVGRHAARVAGRVGAIAFGRGQVTDLSVSAGHGRTCSRRNASASASSPETADELRSLDRRKPNAPPADDHPADRPARATASSTRRTRSAGGVAFVYPGSGNHFPDMGRDLGLAFPHVLRRQMAENDTLRQPVPRGRRLGGRFARRPDAARLDLRPGRARHARQRPARLVRRAAAGGRAVTAWASRPCCTARGPGGTATRCSGGCRSRRCSAPIWPARATRPGRRGNCRTTKPVDWLTGVVSASGRPRPGGDRAGRCGRTCRSSTRPTTASSAASGCDVESVVRTARGVVPRGPRRLDGPLRSRPAGARRLPRAARAADGPADGRALLQRGRGAGPTS